MNQSTSKHIRDSRKAKSHPCFAGFTTLLIPGVFCGFGWFWMASPQVENGFTRIANDIMEALARIRIPGEVNQILLVILRKTYGFHKKEDSISLSQFFSATTIKRPNCIRAINKAVSMNLIIKKDNGKTATYRFNKDFDTWKPLSKKITVIKKDNKSLSKKIHTKDIIQKKEYTTESKAISDFFILRVGEDKGITYKFSGGKDAMAIKRFRQMKDTPDYKDLVEFYLRSPKSGKYLSLSACLSADTINQFNLANEERGEYD